MTLAHRHAPTTARDLAYRITDALDDIQRLAAPCESLTSLLLIGGAAADLAHVFADEHEPVPFSLTPAGVEMIGGAK